MKHIGDIRKYERCEKLLWNAKRYPQPFLAFVYYGEDTIDLAAKKLGLVNTLRGTRGDGNEVFFNNEEKYDAFLSIRFEYNDLRVRIPVMVKNGEGYDLYFTYPNCYPKESEAQGLADTLWVLNQLNIKYNFVKAIYLNAKYVRKDQLDVDELMLVSDYLYNDKNHPGDKIMNLIERRNRNLTPILKRMDDIIKMDKVEKERSQICTKRSKCLYFNQCFEEDKPTSIFNLVNSSHKFELYSKGIKTIDQLDFDDIEGTRHQFAQYMAAKSNKMYFNNDGIRSFFSEVKYPISYLDFEWETFAYPPYKGMKPYDVLAFQYSLHIEDEDGKVKHKQYLGKGDCRLDFIKNLLKDLPHDGTIMCYNVEGAEKLRLKQLAKVYPEYKEVLQSVWERMLDLAIPFANGLIYDNRQAGMYSLKKLVEIFTDYDYKNLEISHGIQAVREYIKLQAEKEPDRNLIDNLYKYCSMDTYAEYLMYHFILDHIE